MEGAELKSGCDTSRAMRMTDQGPGKKDGGASNHSDHSSFLAELRKRRVFRAAAGYAVVAWGATEILDGVISRFGWPDWIATLVVILFVVGFPVAMFLAWVFDWTGEGMRRTEPWTATGGLSVVLATLFLVAGSAGLFWLINPSGVARIEQVGVAVLPCRFRGDPGFAFRGEGVAEILNENLARSRRFFVPEFDTVVGLSGENLSTAGLADRLGVAWLLECRVVQGDGHVQLEAALIDTSSDESEELASVEAGPLELVGAIDKLSRAALKRFGVTPGDRESATPLEYLPSTTRALDAYLQGEQAYRAHTAESLTKARELFRSAQVVPFALARVREADVLMALLELQPPDNVGSSDIQLRAVSLMLDELDRADNPPAEFYVSRLRFANLADGLEFGEPVSLEQRLAWFDRALALKPSDAEPYRLFAIYLAGIGEPEKAADLEEQAGRLSSGGVD